MAIVETTGHILVESTFGDDPDSDGSDYLPGRIIGDPMPVDGFKLAATNYATGRNAETGETPGVDGGSIALEMPMFGLAAAATDASPTPSAIDFIDTLFNAALGTASTINGEGIAGGSTSTVQVDTDIADIEDLILVNFSNRSEWRSITSQSGSGPYTYGVTPNLTGSPDAARDVFGFRYWVPVNGGGTSFSYFSRIGQLQDPAVANDGFRLSGAKPTSLKIKVEAGKEAVISTSIVADSMTQEAKASLPAISGFSTPRIMGKLGTFFWGSTSIGMKSMELDFMLKTVPLDAHNTTNGRGTFLVTAQRPKITIFPQQDLTYRTDFRAATERSVLMQWGSGALAASRANTWGFFAQAAQIKSNGYVNDQKILRNQIVMQVTDGGLRTGNTAYRHWVLGRA